MCFIKSRIETLLLLEVPKERLRIGWNNKTDQSWPNTKGQNLKIWTLTIFQSFTLLLKSTEIAKSVMNGSYSYCQDITQASLISVKQNKPKKKWELGNYQEKKREWELRMTRLSFCICIQPKVFWVDEGWRHGKNYAINENSRVILLDVAVRIIKLQPNYQS